MPVGLEHYGRTKRRMEMGFKRINARGKIGGFWSREVGTMIVGQVKKYVAGENGGFYIIETIEGGVPLQGREEGQEGRNSVVGEIIGVSGSASLDCLREVVNKGIVRLTSQGLKEGKRGKEFWDIEVEHDPDGRPYNGKPVTYKQDEVSGEDIPF